jgi:hypothetical protein
MLVIELIRELSKIDADRVVIMATDAEGNNYSPISSLWKGSYSDISGEVGLEKLTPEDKKAGYSEKDVVVGKRAVVLIPSN